MIQEYLNSSPERAANVAHHVNVDGRTADAPPALCPISQQVNAMFFFDRGSDGRTKPRVRSVRRR